MIINELTVIQQNNCYRILLPNNFHIMDICMPSDGQLFLDSKALELITKTLALRWGVIQPKRK